MAASNFNFILATLIGLLCSFHHSKSLPLEPNSGWPLSNGSCAVSLPRTCKDVVSAAEPRVITILWDGLEVMCDTQTDSGGWLVIQRRTNGNVDFYRNWDEYKYGFGDITDQFWFGNEKVHRLTTQRRYELRVDIKFQGKDYYAVYSNFRLFGEAERYKIDVRGYHGNAGNNLSNSLKFSTKDRDYDSWYKSCAQEFHGAWWYSACHSSNLNGLWLSKEYAKGLTWLGTTGFYDSVTFTEMKIRPVE